MYRDFYGFQDKPFNQTPDPHFIFLSQNHREAIAHLLYGINSHVGFISLTGEVGSGKTTVLRSLLNHLDADHYRTALIFNPSLSPLELLRSIGREFGILSNDANEPESAILDTLNRFLIHENSEQRTVVLVIDEAQDLSANVLEQIRLISNLETDSDKLIQIILAGQPELLDLLKERNLRQLNQRITVRYHLTPLDFEDTAAYINHRVDIAKGRVFFSHRAIAKIYRYSGGLPRLINAACDRALLAGFTRNSKEITGRIADIAIRDLARHGRWSVLKRPLVLYPLLLVAILLAAVPLLFRAGLIPSIFVEPLSLSERDTATGTAATPPGVPGAPDSSRTTLASAGPQKQIQRTPVNLNRDLVSRLEPLSVHESLRSAFNEVARLWKVEAAGDNEVDFEHLQEFLRARELNLLSFRGNLEGLKVLDYPAILELSLPGKTEKRYAALVGVKGDKIALGAPLAPNSLLTIPELERYWTGQAYIPWKNFLQLPETLAPGSRGTHVRTLQKLLRETGIQHQLLTGTYDRETQAAVKIFQVTHGLDPDGVVRFQTLLFLYQSVDRFEAPRLNRPD